MEALWVSTLAVALGEVGDKTQLLTLFLTARFGRPWVVMAAVLVATLLNHALAATVGAWLASFVPMEGLRWLVGVAFVAVGVWALFADRLDEPSLLEEKLGPFVISAVAFFLAEMGDKTQFATIMLSMRFSATFWVIVGTTLGMLLANLPCALLGDRLVARLPLKWFRIGTAVLFILLGLVTVFSGIGG